MCKSLYCICNFWFCSSISEIEARLPRSQLLALCRNEAVLKWMSTCDHLMYQALVEILIPDVLRPIPSQSHSWTISLFYLISFYGLTRHPLLFFPPPGALTQAIRNFAKSLEGWLNNAMNAVPQRMIQTKVRHCCRWPDRCQLSFNFSFSMYCFRLPLSVPLHKLCADTHLWITWLRQHVLCCRTHRKSIRCWVIWTEWTLPMCRSDDLVV